MNTEAKLQWGNKNPDPKSAENLKKHAKTHGL
jgi:hypothetical protein